MTISKAERAELRSIVRQQFKVLREEVEQRKLELLADIEQQVADRYSEQDKAWQGVEHVAHEAWLEANRKINDALRAAGFRDPKAGDRNFFMPPQIEQPGGRDRHLLRQAAAAQLSAKARDALVRLSRQEADLLRNLALGAIESAEAHAFLRDIPTVGELVPAARLAELEAGLGDSL